MTYITFLDGIRALAVMLVFIFHLNPHWISGGFIGVDIFFVISGYLITQIIWQQISTNNFNYLDFMWSRCKRLLPAYLMLILVTSALTAIFLLPNELLNFSQSALSSAFFVSNVFFYLNSGYFDESAESFPLLHTWSLAVEWQFYLVFPIVLILFKRLISNKAFIVLSIFILLSCAISIIVTFVDHSLAFYLSPFRIAEFMLGGIVSFTNSQPKPNKMLYFSASANVSFLVLLFFAFNLNDDSIFPGTNALIVAFTTAILIFSLRNCEKCLIKAIFSSPPLLFLGKISYSLYLWHWPIILFSKYYFEKIHTPIIYLSIIVTTFFCSLISYFLIENSLRKPVFTKKYSILLLAVYFLLISLPVLIIVKTDGLSERLNTKQMEILSVPKWQPFPGICEATQKNDKYYRCLFGNSNVKPKTLLWGDSHSQILVWEYDKIATQNNLSLLSVSKGGCPPIMGGVPFDSPIEKDVCLKIQNNVLTYLQNNPDITDVILAAKWDGYINKKLQTEYPLSNNANVNFMSKLNQTILEIQVLGINVHLIDSIPYPGFSVPETIVRAELLDKNLQNEFFQNIQSIQTTEVLKNIKLNKLNIYKPAEYLCTEGKCELFRNNKPYYFDSNHLSIYGVSKISNILEQTLSLNLQEDSLEVQK